MAAELTPLFIVFFYIFFLLLANNLHQLPGGTQAPQSGKKQLSDSNKMQDLVNRQLVYDTDYKIIGNILWNASCLPHKTITEQELHPEWILRSPEPFVGFHCDVKMDECIKTKFECVSF